MAVRADAAGRARHGLRRIGGAMTLSLLQYVLGGAAGSLVGFSLGLVGGGGSILAVPLMVYLLCVTHPHLAIGASALARAPSPGGRRFYHAPRRPREWHSF